MSRGPRRVKSGKMNTMILRAENVRDALTGRAHRVAALAEGVPAAVLVALLDRADGVHVLLTQRTESVRTHKGQIAFPGGARDEADADLLATALREAREEVGIEPRDVEVVGRLDDYFTVTSFLVSPFVGFIPHPYSYSPSAREIARVIELPLDAFLAPGALESMTVERAGHKRAVLAYRVGGEVVWGVTAAILRQLLDAISAAARR